MATRVLLTIAIIVCMGCNHTNEAIMDRTPLLIYSNSFESSSDTLGWNGQGAWSLYSEAAPSGGIYSLSVWGSDIGPHAEKILDSPVEESQMIFRFWARCLIHSGGTVRLISLAPVAPYPVAGFSITDSVWKSYSDTASFPTGYNLRIWIDGNGAFETPILVDRIEVLRLKK